MCQNLAKYPQKWKNRSRTPKIPPFNCVSAANVWASAHALSMVTWHHQNIVYGYHLIMFTHLINKLIPKGIKKAYSRGQFLTCNLFRRELTNLFPREFRSQNNYLQPILSQCWAKIKSYSQGN